jgi:hypothetical protein
MDSSMEPPKELPKEPPKELVKPVKKEIIKCIKSSKKPERELVTKEIVKENIPTLFEKIKT